MNPALVALFPTVIDLIQEVSKTDAGKEILGKTKKIIEIALPKVQMASEIAIQFLAIDVTGGEKSTEISLSKNLPILDSGLNLPLSYQRNQSVKFKNQISADLDVIKGQNEILFLSNSINYFIESHKSITGIDRGISYALQYDIQAVCNHLKKNPDIRFPGYLLHQLVGLTNTIEELNIFYNSILHDGKVYSRDDKDHYKSIFDETIGIDNKQQQGDYIPQAFLLEWQREQLLKTEIPKSTSIFESVKGLVSKEQQQILNDEAHDTLYLLKAELESALLHKDLKCKAPLIEPNLRRNLGKWST